MQQQNYNLVKYTEDLNRHSSIEDTPVANKHMKNNAQRH